MKILVNILTLNFRRSLKVFSPEVAWKNIGPCFAILGQSNRFFWDLIIFLIQSNHIYYFSFTQKVFLTLQLFKKVPHFKPLKFSRELTMTEIQGFSRIFAITSIRCQTWQVVYNDWLTAAEAEAAATATKSKQSFVLSIKV